MKPEVKTTLKKAGRWSEFVALRDTLKRGGASAKDAALQAAERVLQEQEADSPQLPDEADVELAGKESTPIEVVLWVARNIERSRPDKATCPDLIAWGLLQACQRSPMVAADFWKMYVSKGLAKVDVEKPVREKDGQHVIDIIDRLLEASAKAKAKAKGELSA